MSEIPSNVYYTLAGRIVYEKGFLNDLLDNPRYEFTDTLIQIGMNPTSPGFDELLEALENELEKYKFHQIKTATKGYLREGDNAEMI